MNRLFRWSSSIPTHMTPALALVAALLWGTLLGAGLSSAAQAADAPQEKWTVTVLATPDTAIGSYRVETEDGTARIVHADGNTEFDHDQVPTVGQTVEAEGVVTEPDRMHAARIRIVDSDPAAGDDGGATAELVDKRPDDNGHGELCTDPGRDEWKGRVLTRPAGDQDLTGDWTIAAEGDTVVTVRVDAQTRFDRGLPRVGDWVEVRGTLLDANTCLVQARRMRPDDIEGGEVIVRLKSNGQPQEIVRDERYDLDFVRTLLRSGNIHLFRSTEDDVDETQLLALLQEDPRVEWAEFNYVGSVPESDGYKTWGWGDVELSGYENQQAFTQINLTPAHAHYTGAGVVVAVLDTGVEAGHSAFAGRLLDGRDMVDDDVDPQEATGGVAWGHGTHVMGVVAAVAPDAQLLPVRVLDANGRGNMFTLAYAIEWAVDHGADVVNLKLGAEVDSRVLADTIQAAQADGVIIVAAAGNQGDDAVQYPAAFPGVLSVAAVAEDGTRAAFSSYGASRVDLAAPGVGIVSTVPDYDADGVDDYSAWSGTSMAAPFVSGAVALARQQAPHAATAVLSEQLLVHLAALDDGEIGGLLDVAATLGVNPDSPDNPDNPEQPVTSHELFLPLIVNR